MEFNLTPDQAQFVKDFDNYLRTQMPAQVQEDLGKDMMYSESPACRDFIRQMGRDGWLGIGWPKEYGGQGKGAIEQHLFFEVAKFHRAPVPVLPLNTIGPTIIRHGSEEQKQFFLPKILK